MMKTDKKQNFYEIGYHLSPEIPEGEVSTSSNKIKSLIEKMDGAVKSGDIKRRRLAYPLKKHKESYFGFFKFVFSPDKILKLKNELNLDKQILRFMILTQTATQFEPKSAVATLIPPRQTSAILKKKPAVSVENKTTETPIISEKDDKKGMEELDKTLEKILGDENTK